MGMKYTTFQTLTVRQYQELYAIHTGKDEDIDKIIQSVCVLTGLTEKGVEAMSIPDFNKVSSELSVIFRDKFNAKPKPFIEIAGKKYMIIYNPADLSAGQYIEIQSWCNANLIDNIPKIMASLVYPEKGVYDSKNHRFLSEAILDCNFIEVYAVCLFFSTLWKNSIVSLGDYLERNIQGKIQKDRLKIILGSLTDGYTMPVGLANLKTSA